MFYRHSLSFCAGLLGLFVVNHAFEQTGLSAGAVAWMAERGVARLRFKGRVTQEFTHLMQRVALVADLAKAAGVNVETIRFYQRKGLMPEPDRPVGSIRRYGRTDQSRLSFIKSAKRLGFSLDETAQLLQLDDGASCAQARTHAESKLAEVQLKLADLHRMEAVLSELIHLCDSGRGKIRCPLIAAMERQSPPLQI